MKVIRYPSPVEVPSHMPVVYIGGWFPLHPQGISILGGKGKAVDATIPEDGYRGDTGSRIEWESAWMGRADLAVFWFPALTQDVRNVVALWEAAHSNLPVFVGVDPDHADARILNMLISSYLQDLCVHESVEDLAGEVQGYLDSAFD